MTVLSVITPTYNEEDSILDCISKLREVMNRDCPEISYEHIIIDNASLDGTANLALAESRNDPRVKVLVNSRNVGASRSIYRALSRATGQWVVPMLPADLQDPAEVIPEMIREASNGNEIVYGLRLNRQESFVIRNLRKIYYRVLGKFSPYDLQNDAGEFVLISARIKDSIIAINDQNPYVRGLIAQSGAKFSSVPYTWNRRSAGKSKSSPLVLADVAISGMVSTTYIPARIALLVGFTISTLGVIAGFAYFLLSLVSNHHAAAGIPTLIISIFFLGGVQLFFLGLIGEYVLSIHRQVKPEAVVTSTIESNFESN